MTPFTRVEARDFRALFTRCVAGRPRGPAHPVVIQIRGERRTVTATTPDGVTLTHTSPAPKERDDHLLLPATVLAEVEGGTDEIVTLERQSKLLAVVRWHGGTKPRTLPVGLILPGKQHEIPGYRSYHPLPRSCFRRFTSVVDLPHARMAGSRYRGSSFKGVPAGSWGPMARSPSWRPGSSSPSRTTSWCRHCPCLARSH